MIKVKICCGTSCYIMGSSELISMDVLKQQSIDLQGSTCMNLCKEGDKRPPYITIDDETYSQVTPDKLNKLIEEKLNAL